MILPENIPSNELVEIELAYLVSCIPDEVQASQPQPYVDTYLSNDNDLITKLRLRKKGAQFELTKKIVFDTADTSVQGEFNIPLTEDEYKMFRQLGRRELEKDRYVISLQDRHAEVDIFKGLLTGLVIIEFEFGSQAERDAFTPPDICIADVTQEDFIAGAYLAGKHYVDIEPQLQKFGYRPLG